MTSSPVVDVPATMPQTHPMPASLIVLNGPSSSGKSTIAREMQRLWPRPLWTTGLDVLIAGWPTSFVEVPADDGTSALASTGIRIVPGDGPPPSWIPEFGSDFHNLTRVAHEAWSRMSRGGVDLLIDHVILDATLREQARSSLVGALWVGVTCDVDELVRREAERGDRYVGFASGSSAVVHEAMNYDLTVDTTVASPEVLARQIFDAAMSSNIVDGLS